MPVGAGGLNGVGRKVGSENSTNSGQSNSFDELEGGATEGVPDSFFGKRAGEAGHRSGERRVGGGGNILLAVGESGIGGEAGTEFDKIAHRGGVDFDCPWGFAGVVKKIGAEGVNALRDLADS